MLRVTTLVLNKPQPLNKKLIGSLSSDDGDIIKNDEKQEGLDLT